jgi:hypothetical protein
MDDYPDYLSLESPLATPREEAQIHELRGLIGDALLEPPHRDFPEVVGDIALLRYLRGRDHDVVDAARVFRAHLDLRKQHGLDEMRTRIAKLGDRWDKYTAHDFTDGAAILKRMPWVYNAGLSPHGHVITYIPVGVQDSRTLWSEVGLERYMRFSMEEWIARDIQLDRLSREKGRLIKLILIIDLTGLSLTSSQVTFAGKKQYDRDWQAILETKPETTIRWYRLVPLNSPYPTELKTP